MSMFSGLTNQISGWVANKQGKAGEAGAEGENPAVAEGQQQENGDDPVGEGAEAAGASAGTGVGAGVSGLAQGLMQKAMSAKEGIKEKASNFHTPNLQGLGNNLMQGVTNLIPGRREEEVPTPPEPNPPSDIGGGEVVEADGQVNE